MARTAIASVNATLPCQKCSYFGRILPLEQSRRILYLVFLKPLFRSAGKGLFAFVGQAHVH
jgi:hypothetical protein